MEKFHQVTKTSLTADPSQRSRRVVFAAGALCLLLGGVSVKALAEDLKLAHQFAPDSLPGKSAVYFANLVKQRTNGASWS